MWTSILIAVLVLLALAVVFGGLLGFAAERFRVEGNPLVDQIDSLLPQTQCGQCGFPGCRPYAESIANGDAINKCPPGGETTIKALADLLDVEPQPLDAEHGVEQAKRVAVIREDECIGCTKCIQACPVDAILGAAKHMHTVIESECTGCDLCVEPCPVDCIDMITIEPDIRAWTWTPPRSGVIATDRQGSQRLMTQLWDFSGGIHPEENKHISTARPIEKAGLPGVLILPLQQHIGEPAEACVAIGKRVLKGQKIADVTGGMGVPVHAPTSGTIESVSLQPVPHPSGMSDWCITLRPDGEDEWTTLSPVGNYRDQDRDTVLNLIREAGISGMGGAGFPTNIKLRPPSDRKVNTLILNGAECEPYITADDMSMREKADEILAGLRIMAWILRPERCVIAVEDNKPEAIAALRKAAEGTQTEIATIPTKYPSGGEKQLIQILTGMEVPSGGIPADIGVMCQNVGTAIAVSAAIFRGEPLISRITTVTGHAVTNPGNFEVLLGTPIEYLLSQAGLDESALHRLVLGGPMMGYTLETPAVPVVKTTNCVIAATEAELPDPAPEQPCIRCGACAEACPMELLPQQLFWYSKAGELDKAEHLNLFDCIECGICSYVCPSSIPLVQYCRAAKGEIRVQQAEQLKADRARERFEARQARLEREQQEKEQRRKERAKAAAEAQARKEAEAEAGDSKPADDRAAKSAQVQEALARKKAKARQATTPDSKPAEEPETAPAPDIDALEKQLSQATAKLNTMQSMLDDAKAENADNVEKLERAVTKNHDRVKRAEEALAEARRSLETSEAQTTDS